MRALYMLLISTFIGNVFEETPVAAKPYEVRKYFGNPSSGRHPENSLRNNEEENNVTNDNTDNDSDGDGDNNDGHDHNGIHNCSSSKDSENSLWINTKENGYDNNKIYRDDDNDDDDNDDDDDEDETNHFWQQLLNKLMERIEAFLLSFICEIPLLNAIFDCDT